MGPRAQPWSHNYPAQSRGHPLFQKCETWTPAGDQEEFLVYKAAGRRARKEPEPFGAEQAGGFSLTRSARRGKQMCSFGKGGTGDMNLRSAFPEVGRPSRPQGCFLQGIRERLRCGLWRQRPEATQEPLLNKSFQWPLLGFLMLKVEVIMPWVSPGQVNETPPP